jgi:GNAT superfamily N-acetyltransferase
MLPRADYVTFVAEAADVVVGLVGAYLGCALEFTEPYGRLTGLVVDEQWRGRGIGSLLLAKVEGWLSGKGASLVTLTSGKHRIESHVFYGKLGYEETGLRFAKRL